MNFLNKITDKVVVNDITKYCNDRDYHHLFYHIRTAITPNGLIEYQISEKIAYLYVGDIDDHNYVEIIYDFYDKKYIFSTTHHKDKTVQFESKSWEHMYDYVNNYISSIIHPDNK